MDAALEQAVTQAIDEHLAQNPQAADSAAGVARWWLPPRGVTASAAEVEPVLLALVRHQRLRSVRLADGTVLFCSHRTALH